jgi:hypothetical protein
MALPLLLCGAVVVLWIRSHWVKDAVEFRFGNTRWELASEFGRCTVSNGPQVALDRAAQRAYFQAVRDSLDANRTLGLEMARVMKAISDAAPPERPETEAEAAARRAKRSAASAKLEALRKMRAASMTGWGKMPPITPATSSGVPHWLVAAFLAVPPGARAVRRWWARRRAALRGMCRCCGYDLRATPDRCPECGGVPEHSLRL